MTRGGYSGELTIEVLLGYARVKHSLGVVVSKSRIGGTLTLKSYV